MAKRHSVPSHLCRIRRVVARKPFSLEAIDGLEAKGDTPPTLGRARVAHRVNRRPTDTSAEAPRSVAGHVEGAQVAEAPIARQGEVTQHQVGKGEGAPVDFGFAPGSIVGRPGGCPRWILERCEVGPCRFGVNFVSARHGLSCRLGVDVVANRGARWGWPRVDLGSI